MNCPSFRPDQVQRYRQRLSGPLLDRFDLLLQLNRIAPGELLGETEPAEDSATVRARVSRARERAMARQGCENARLAGTELKQHCELENSDRRRLERAAEKLGLSMRACQRVLKVSRSIADMESSGRIQRPHLVEALAYRQAAAASRHDAA